MFFKTVSYKYKYCNTTVVLNCNNSFKKWQISDISFDCSVYYAVSTMQCASIPF